MMLHSSPSSNGPRQIAQSSSTDAVQHGDGDGFHLLRQPGVRLLLVLMIVFAAQADDDKDCCDDEESKEDGIHPRWTNHDDKQLIITALDA
jgi:hypothetical protein